MRTPQFPANESQLFENSNQSEPGICVIVHANLKRTTNKMNQQNQLFLNGSSTQVEAATALEPLLFAIQTAAGVNPTWKIQPYRVGVKNYVAVDIDGVEGALNLTIGICGEILIPTTSEILQTREAVILVQDAFDAFHLVLAISTRIRRIPGGSSFLQFPPDNMKVT